MLVQLYHSQLQSILGRFYDTLLSLMLHGTFGIGKTAAVRRFAQEKAKKLGLKYSESFKDVNKEDHFCFLSLVLHQYEPAELKGLPFPNEARTSTVYLPVGLLPEKGKGIVFLDEINLASPMMQSNAYQLIEDRRIGFYEVPAGYMVCGAGNKDDDRGHTFEMAMPLNNRFLHAELLVPPVDDIDVDGEVIKGWVNDYALNSGVDHRVINYLSYQKGHLYNYNPEIEGDITIATPRIWDKVSRLIAGVTDENQLAQFVGMGVGTAIANEFVAWLKLSKKYDLKKIYKDGTFEKPSEIDILYSLISALVSHYAEKPSDESAVIALDLSQVFNKEHTVMMLNQLKSVDEKYFERVKKSAPQKFRELSNSLFKLLI